MPQSSRRRSLLGPALVVLSSLLFGAVSCTGGRSKESAPGDWASKIEFKVEQGEGELLVVIEGIPGWYVNTLYPGIRLSLVDEGGRESGEAMGRSEVRFEERSGEDKARRAVFSVPLGSGASGSVQGTYRAVVCKEDACSPPFSGEISLPLSPP